MERFCMCWVKSLMGKLHDLQNYDLLLGPGLTDLT